MNITYLINPYNRDRQTYNTLMRLSHLTFPQHIICIDDGSTDDLKKFIDLLPYSIEYIKRDKKEYDSSVIPRNIGIKLCTTEYILIGDPEVLWITDVVAQMREQAEKYPEKVIIAGTCYFTSPDTPMDEWLLQTDPRELMKKWEIRQFPFHKKDQFDENGKQIDWHSKIVTFDRKVQATFCGLFKKEWLLEIGGYDENMAVINGGGGWGFDDIDLLTRLAANGHPQIGIPEIEVLHQYHKRPPQTIADGWARNEEIMKSRLGEIIVNQNKEWGILSE
jgi:GT2 family glycosyltransferase